MPIRLTLLLVSCFALLADTGLDSMSASLHALRGKPEALQPATARHQLRDWVESRLPGLAVTGDEGDFARKLNTELTAASLICGEKCPAGSLAGYLEGVQLRRVRGFLLLQTGLGVSCGFGESAYLYSWSSTGWRRVFQTEPARQPETIRDVLISGYNKANHYVALTLGSDACRRAVWGDVYYRAFQVGAPEGTAPLVEGTEAAYFLDPPLQGSVSLTDVAVTFAGRSIDNDVLIRTMVRHFQLTPAGAKRVGPLALTPRDFVDEWLTHEGDEAWSWSETANRGSMNSWHGRLHKDIVLGQFVEPTKHCAARPDLWEVGVDFSDPPTPASMEPQGIYFLVRWRPPYQFTLVGVGDAASPDCMEEDPAADATEGLFLPAR